MDSDLKNFTNILLVKNMKFFISLFFILLIFSACSQEISTNLELENSSCYTTQTIIVNGNSMYPMIQSGQELTHKVGFYKCNEILIGDVITYNFSGNKNLLLKQIKAVPNDKFDYANNTVLINSVPLKNSQNQTYNLDSEMLSLYAKTYPIIPENTYLILGDNIKGSTDSSKFGLISKQQIIGKVEIN